MRMHERHGYEDLSWGLRRPGCHARGAIVEALRGPWRGSIDSSAGSSW